MMVGDLVETYIHKADRKMVSDIYANEMTISEFIEDKEDYIYELEHQLSNIKDILYHLNTGTDEIFKKILDSPLRYEDIKKH